MGLGVHGRGQALYKGQLPASMSWGQIIRSSKAPVVHLYVSATLPPSEVALHNIPKKYLECTQVGCDPQTLPQAQAL